MLTESFLVALLSYLLGGIPFGYIAARARGIDITKHGSGATGATNVLRTLGTGPAIMVALLDISKGVVAVVASGRAYGQDHRALGLDPRAFRLRLRTEGRAGNTLGWRGRAGCQVDRALGGYLRHDRRFTLTGDGRALGMGHRALGGHLRHDRRFTLTGNRRTPGRFRRALGRVRRAFGRVHRALGRFHWAFGGFRRALGRFLRAFGDLRRALGRFRRAFGGFRRAFGGFRWAFGD